jgi:hypothetical protein
MAHRLPYLLGLSFTVVSWLLCCIGFGTGYWWVTTDEESWFLSAGLWQICFNGYQHTSDLIGKAYYSCWWIFYREYYYIRDWIMPPWFQSVQVLMSFAIAFQFIALVLYPLCYRNVNNVRYLSLTCLVELLISSCTTTSVVVFGVMIGLDRTWMPRWETNVLGWSYGLVVLSGFLSWFSAIAVIVYTLARKYDIETEKQKTCYKSRDEPSKKAALMPRV